MPHTRKWYREEHTFPRIIDRDTYDYWVSLGEKDVAQRAAEEADKILSEKPANLLDEDKRKELLNIMTADAQNNGLSKLPKLNSE
jgi:trimethylamine--corrinoid protein Co-methyltransferase